MNVDVSPDGRTIAFDLLGDIYTMPIAGGRPTRISSGLAFDMQPRFSPDGRLIAFTSDRGGGDNIWVMNARRHRRARDHPRDLPPAQRADLEPATATISPRASISPPSARSAPARSGSTTSPASATACLWSSGPTRNSRRNWASRPSPPTAARSISAATPRPATPSNMPRIRTSRCSRSSATTWRPASAPRSPAAPAARSGRRLRPTAAGSPTSTAPAAARRLFVKDLRSGEERQVYADLDQDLQETWAVHGVYPNMGWTPDSNTHRLLGRRQDPAGQPRRLRRRRNPVPGQRHPRRDRSAAARDRGRAGQRHHPHAALRPGLAGRQPGRLRDARPALHPRHRRRRAAPADRAGRRFPALPDLVARRQPDRLRLVERPAARRNPHRRGGRLGPAHGHPAARPLPPPALLARRRDHRLRSERRPGPDLEPLVEANRHLPRARRRRRLDPDPRRGRQPAFRRRSRTASSSRSTRSRSAS